MVEREEIYHLKNEDWQRFLSELSKKLSLYAPGEGLVEPEYRIFGPENLSEIIYGGARLTESVKSFVYPSRQKVSPAGLSRDKKAVVFGVKACDLRALSILDGIFLDSEFTDPFYQKIREDTILISDDCTEPRESCFCTLLGDSPYPEKNFDLNLSLLDEGCLVEVGSAKGKTLLEEYNLSMQPATEEQLNLRQKSRQETIKELEEKNRDFKIPQDIRTLVEGKYDSPSWTELSEDCVSCGACTNICPACNCFLLSEVSSGKFDKVRYWDSCQYAGYARVAGGANPRKKLMERFRNRFYCKFEYKPKNFNLLACTGCGRCIEACQGKIDTREVLTKVAASKG